MISLPWGNFCSSIWHLEAMLSHSFPYVGKLSLPTISARKISKNSNLQLNCSGTLSTSRAKIAKNQKFYSEIQGGKTRNQIQGEKNKGEQQSGEKVLQESGVCFTMKFSISTKHPWSGDLARRWGPATSCSQHVRELGRWVSGQQVPDIDPGKITHSFYTQWPPKPQYPSNLLLFPRNVIKKRRHTIMQ